MTREALILSGVPLAKREARKLSGRLRMMQHREDMESAGYAALCKAADQFDAGRGVKFTAFAALRVRGAMIDYVRRINQSRRFKRKGLQSPQFSSLAIHSDESERARQLAAPQRPPTFMESADAVTALTCGLSPKARRMLIAYYAEGKTQDRISREMNLSPSRVSQLFARALSRLRQIRGAQVQ
jgi:RNA polymerase sigma factor (sigma-70 family)